MRKLETALLVLSASVLPASAAAQTSGILAAGGGDDIRELSDTMFSRWDKNGNDRLEGDEFLIGLHQRWSGIDEKLNEQEYLEHWDDWFVADAPIFTALDKNNDSNLSPTELLEPLTDSDLRGEWQGVDDAVLTREDFWAGLNKVSDLDQSGTLDAQETVQLRGVVAVQSPADGAPAISAGAETRVNPSRVAVGQIIPLSQWDPDAVYENAWSAEALFDRPVFGAEGERIGDVEDLVVAPDGHLLSLVAEVGGFWDLGDTHVSVPWDQVELRLDGTIAIPVTEDNADDFSVLRDEARQVGEEIVSGIDNEELGPRAWRASELIGDIARVRNPGAQEPSAYDGYGYVEDLVFNNGKITAAVVDLDPAGPDGPGEIAYPFYGYGYGYGWEPGSRYYDLPYDRQEAATVKRFDADRLNQE